MKRAALAAIIVACILAAIKCAAWLFTGSVAMLASFADSGLDLAASTLNALAIRHALTPADEEHRFGHGKTEAIAGMAQAALVGGSGVFLVLESVDRILHPQPVEYPGWGLAVALGSILVTGFLTWYQSYVVKRTGSLAIAADSLHYLTDLVSNGAVVAAIVLAGWFGVMWADGVFGLAIAAMIGWSAWHILSSAFDHLNDRELTDEDRAKIKQIAKAVPGIIGIHDLRTRMSGSAQFIQFHAVMDAGLTLMQAHELSDRVEGAIKAVFPKAEIIIHEDPSGLPEHHAPLAYGHR